MIESRLINASDRNWVISILTNKIVTKFLPIREFSPQVANEFFEKYLKIHDKGDPYGIYIYSDLESKEKVGYGVCRRFEWESGINGIEIGYIIHPDHWGKGVASFIAKDLMHRVGSSKETIYALIHNDNVPSQRVVQKLGFSHFKEAKDHKDASIWMGARR